VARFRRTLTFICTLSLAFSITACNEKEEANYALPFSTPLDEFLGASIWQNADEVRRAGDDLNNRREELIAQCMREAGFDYIPDPNSGRWTVGTIVGDETQPNSREWVTRYGFGIVSGQWQSRFSNNQRIGSDPNEEHFNTLNESEQAAFLIALNGPPNLIPSPNMTEADWANFWRNRGCWGNSQQKAFEESSLSQSSNDEFASLFEAINEMWTSVSDSIGMEAIYRDWSDCMADQGHPRFERPYDAAASIAEEFNLLQFLGDDDVFAANAIRENELELAVTDFNCRESINYQTRRNALFFAAENQFVEDHRSALEAYRAAAEQRD